MNKPSLFTVVSSSPDHVEVGYLDDNGNFDETSGRVLYWRTTHDPSYFKLIGECSSLDGGANWHISSCDRFESYQLKCLNFQWSDIPGSIHRDGEDMEYLGHFDECRQTYPRTWNTSFQNSVNNSVQAAEQLWLSLPESDRRAFAEALKRIASVN